MSSEHSTPTVQQTTEQRQAEYGDWKEDGGLADALIIMVESQPRWNAIPGFLRQSIRMILVKIARLVSGNSMNRDSWHDIQGYALIAEQRLPSEDWANRVG